MVGVIGPGPHLDVTLLGLAGVINGQYFLISGTVHHRMDSRDPENCSGGVEDNIVDICLAGLQINLSIKSFLEIQMLEESFNLSLVLLYLVVDDDVGSPDHAGGDPDLVDAPVLLGVPGEPVVGPLVFHPHVG